jgi:hypothetical protein
MHDVDHLAVNRAPHGGFAEYGLRREAACAALGSSAIEQVADLCLGRPTFRTLKVVLMAVGLSRMAFDSLDGRRALSRAAIGVWRAVLGDPGTSEDERALLLGTIGMALMIKDLEYAVACGGTPEW